MDLSVIVPVFNEAERLPQTLRRLLAFQKNYPGECELIIVDDGSTDQTGELIKKIIKGRPRIFLLAQGRNLGKGAAVRTGLAKARGKIILFTDCDLSVPLSEFRRLKKAMGNRDVFVFASRGLARSRLLKRQHWAREGLGRLFNLAVQILLLPGVWDSQCGFKLMPQKVVQAVLPYLGVDRFGFDVEMLYVAKRLGFRLLEVPVVWRNSPDSRVKALLDGWRMLRDLLSIRVRHGRLRPMASKL